MLQFQRFHHLLRLSIATYRCIVRSANTLSIHHAQQQQLCISLMHIWRNMRKKKSIPQVKKLIESIIFRES